MRVYRNGLAAPAGTVASPLEADLDAGGNKVTDVGTPSTGTDAATKAYVDTAAALAVHLAGAETVTGVKTFSAAFKLATYTVATLPTATVRQAAYCSDGRKTGEGGGAGTGVLVYADGTAWRRSADDSTVLA